MAKWGDFKKPSLSASSIMRFFTPLVVLACASYVLAQDSLSDGEIVTDLPSVSDRSSVGTSTVELPSETGADESNDPSGLPTDSSVQPTSGAGASATPVSSAVSSSAIAPIATSSINVSPSSSQNIATSLGTSVSSKSSSLAVPSKATTAPNSGALIQPGAIISVAMIMAGLVLQV